MRRFHDEEDENQSVLEEKYQKKDRKAGKFERKIIRAKDRSKYKKTDQDQITKNQKLLKFSETKEGTLRGKVLSIISQGIVVAENGKTYICTLKGSLKKDKSLLKNLVIVGDSVFFYPTTEGEGVISFVEPRKSVLSRADNLSRRKEQLIAANVDQVFIVTSVVDPPLKPYLLDRYIIAAEKGGMKPVIIVNKIDLLDSDDAMIEDERALYEAIVEAYTSLNISIISTSVEKDVGLDLVRLAMHDKVSVFSGQSGVGKTSLINAVTGLNLRVGKTVDRTKKGAHTTSSAQLLPLEFGGWCIDTPGIKSFGVWDLKRDEIEGYFDEIHSIGMRCKFPDCTHTQEEDCAVLQALKKNKISPLRYDSYQALIESVMQEHLRR